MTLTIEHISNGYLVISDAMSDGVLYRDTVYCADTTALLGVIKAFVEEPAKEEPKKGKRKEEGTLL